MSERRRVQRRKRTRPARNHEAPQVHEGRATPAQNLSRETPQTTLNVSRETPTDAGNDEDEVDGCLLSGSSGIGSIFLDVPSVSGLHKSRDSGINELSVTNSREVTPERTFLSESQPGTSNDTNHPNVLSSLPPNPDRTPASDRVAQETSSRTGSGKTLTSATRRPISLDEIRIQRTSTNQHGPEMLESGSQGAAASAIVDSHPPLDFRNASYPYFVTRESRKASFVSWRPDHTHKPEDFIDVGLFYAGYADCVRCFYCGLGLKYWRADDKPIDQHARYRPNCVYIIMYAGQPYVDKVQRDLLSQQVSQTSTQSSTQGRESTNTFQGAVSQTGQHCLKEDNNALLHVPSNLDAENRRFQTELQRDVESENRDSGVPNVDEVDHGEIIASHHHTDSAQSSASAVPSEARSEIHPNTSTERPAMKELNLHEEMKVVEREHSYLKARLTCNVCLQRPVHSLYMPCGHVIAVNPVLTLQRDVNCVIKSYLEQQIFTSHKHECKEVADKDLLSDKPVNWMALIERNWLTVVLG